MMSVYRGLRGGVALLAACLWAMPAAAVELVAGGYGDPGVSDAADWTRPSRLALGTGPTPFVVRFTPRTMGAFLVPGDVGGTASGVPGHPTAEGAVGTLGRLGLSSLADRRSGFLVGGAFRLDDIVVSAAFARPTLLGAPGELFAAGMSLGGISATLGYARRFERDSDPLDLLMLRTDLEALPWLSFESEVAVGESVEDGSLAVGRVGVRVNF